ncbi:MAG: hypothetical protein GC149_03290 [Gammaproteobacteria bacterium]|nr:hypothetical protein [Gammaproteobacteria bacterium]
MQRFVTYMLVWLTVVIAAAFLFNSMLEQGKTAITSVDKRSYARHVALLKAAEAQYREQRYQAALQTLDDGHALFAQAQVPDQLHLAYYLLKGKVHWSLWEYIEADQAWSAATRYARTSKQRQVLTKLTHDSRQVVNDINRERDQREVYLASPHVGPAAALKGKIVLVYIFVVDGGGDGWSVRDRGYVLDNWRAAQAWLQTKAQQYGSETRFSQRVFLIDKNPQVNRMRVGDLNTKFRHADDVVTLVARQLGYPDMLSLSEDIKRQEGADQAMVLLHIARDGRSYASRCMHGCSALGEFVVLFEAPRSKRWQSLQYAQAHESLHLFGADDLYNIRQAKYYDVRDIMNYPSSLLQASTLETLTAWSVGLGIKKPATPFKIKTFH